MKLSQTYKIIRPSVFAFAQELDSRFFCFGSGVCVDPSGIIVTARHVVNDTPSEELPDVYFTKEPINYCLLNSKKEKAGGFSMISAEPIAILMHKYIDVAVVKIPPLDGGWSYAKFPPVWNVIEGEEVATSGFPLRDYENLSVLPNLFTGIVSQIQEEYSRENNEWKINNLVLDISLHKGNSGGPIFRSSTGELLGIVSSQLLRNSDESPDSTIKVWTNIISCVPWTQIKPLVDEMKDKFKNS